MPSVSNSTNIRTINRAQSHNTRARNENPPERPASPSTDSIRPEGPRGNHTQDIRRLSHSVEKIESDLARVDEIRRDIRAGRVEPDRAASRGSDILREVPAAIDEAQQQLDHLNDSRTNETTAFELTQIEDLSSRFDQARETFDEAGRGLRADRQEAHYGPWQNGGAIVGAVAGGAIGGIAGFSGLGPVGAVLGGAAGAAIGAGTGALLGGGIAGVIDVVT